MYFESNELIRTYVSLKTTFLQCQHIQFTCTLALLDVIEFIILCFAAVVCSADVAANSASDNSNTTIIAIIVVVALLAVVIILGLVYAFVRFRIQR